MCKNKFDTSCVTIYSQIRMETLNNGATVSVFYQREGEEDFVIKIRSVADGYRIQVTDRDGRDAIENEFVFTNLYHLTEYLKTLHESILDDHDTEHPFTYFQYAIPFYPSVIIPIPFLQNHNSSYRRFHSALELFFRA
jgi:hypothetical protein